MKKLILALSIFLLSVVNINAQQNPSITIVNNTGYLVYYVYISPTASNSWGQDFLAANETLPNGHAVTLQLPHPLNVVNHYDLRLVDSDGDGYVKMNTPVTANSRIVFTFSDFVGQ